jgi:lysophosphatidylcholine acyltransferase/lyso-PAF acetyltransferase
MRLALQDHIIWSLQFLYGSAHVLKQPLFRQACELAFTECDTGGHGLISEQEVY